MNSSLIKDPHFGRVAKHCLKKKIMVSQNKKAARRAKA
jgi:hypothetical protein